MDRLDLPLLPSFSPEAGDLGDPSRVLLCDGQDPMMCANNNQLTALRPRTTNAITMENLSGDDYAKNTTKLLGLTPLDDSAQKEYEEYFEDIDKLNSILGELEWIPQSQDVVAGNTELADKSSTSNSSIEITLAPPAIEGLPKVTSEGLSTIGVHVNNSSQTAYPSEPVMLQILSGPVVLPGQPGPVVLNDQPRPVAHQGQLVPVVLQDQPGHGFQEPNPNAHQMNCDGKDHSFEFMKIINLQPENGDGHSIYSLTSDSFTANVQPDAFPTTQLPSPAVAVAPTVSDKVSVSQLKPISPKDPNTESSRNRRRGRDKKVPLYKQNVKEDEEAEKKRQNACNARKNRVRKKEEENQLRQQLTATTKERDQLRDELEKLRSANVAMEARLDAIHKALTMKE